MATIQNALQIYNAAPPVLETVSRKVQALSVDFAALQQASADSLNVVAFQTAKDKAEAMYQCMEEGIQQADTAQRQLNNTVQKGADAMGNLVGKLTGKLFSAESFEKVMSLSDELGTSRTRLGTMNHLQGEGGLESTGQVQDRVFETARNSGTSYMDTANTVANLGMTAGSAFGGTEEIIAFAEQMNKQFQIAGLNVEEQRNATDSLVASMAAGGVQGSEFMSMMQNAPMLAQAIADSMGVSVDVLSNMSDQGLITADVIKNAMFASAAATDEAFGNIPMTFERLKSIVGDSLLQTFAPLLETIGQAAQWIYENWAALEPLFYGLAAAVGVYALAIGWQAAATWLADAASKQWMLSLLSNPLLWIALVIGLVVAAIYKWVQSVGGLQIAWLTVMTAIKNTAAKMKVDVLLQIQQMVNGAISLINFFIEQLNKIPGVSIELIKKVQFGTEAAIEYEAVKKANDAELAAAKAEALRKKVETNTTGFSNPNATSFAGSNVQTANTAALLAGSGMPSYMADTAANTAQMADTMNGSKEDLKYLRDVAEKEAVNRFTTAALKIDMTNHNKIDSEMDLDGVVAHLESKVYETMLVAAEGVYE